MSKSRGHLISGQITPMDTPASSTKIQLLPKAEPVSSTDPRLMTQDGQAIAVDGANTRCFFLDWTPREIRDMIYEYALYSKDGIIFECMTWKGHCSFRRDDQAGWPPVECAWDMYKLSTEKSRGLVSTCKQIYKEARTIPFKVNKICFDDQKDVIESTWDEIEEMDLAEARYGYKYGAGVETWMLEGAMAISLAKHIRLYLDQNTQLLDRIRHTKSVEFSLRHARLSREMCVRDEEIRIENEEAIRALARLAKDVFPKADVHVVFHSSLFREQDKTLLTNLAEGDVFSSTFVPHAAVSPGCCMYAWEIDEIKAVVGSICERYCQRPKAQKLWVLVEEGD